MIDNLVKLSEQDRPIGVRIDGFERVAAEVFPVPGGVGFADTGWNSPHLGANPFHIVQGQLVDYSETAWEFVDGEGQTVVFWLMDEDDDLLEDWIDWLKARDEQGRPYERNEARLPLENLAS